MRSLTWTLAVLAALSLPVVALATEPSTEPAPPAVEPAPTAVVPGAGSAPAAPSKASGARFKPAPARGIQPTVSRLPSYWQCQDNLDRRLVVTYLDTKTPSVILERGSSKVIATLQRSGSGAKYMAPGGILFWERGKEATLQWGNPKAASCSSLGG